MGQNTSEAAECPPALDAWLSKKIAKPSIEEILFPPKAITGTIVSMLRFSHSWAVAIRESLVSSG